MDAGWFIVLFVMGAIWGYVAYKVILNKGYDKKEAQKWEIIGFFLGIIGVLIALSKPDLNQNQNNNYIQQSAADELKKIKELYDQGILTEAEYNQKRAELLKKI